MSYLSVCEEAARSAGRILREMLGTIHVRHKRHQFDLVTEADIAAQTAIEKIILGEYPNHGFLGEEGNLTQIASRSDSELRWIADPLDGTTNYVHQLPLFCTSIALTQGTNILCGVVYNPISEEFFSAEQGKGTFLNGQRIQTSSWESLSEALVSVSFSAVTSEATPDLNAFLKTMPVCQAIRRTGSTALNLAYVAAGRFDATWAFTCHPWDIAAGAILVTEAGGIVTQPSGKPLTFDNLSPICAVANQPLHKELMSVLNG
jgi:myo-inositol-1(or 4)-monophosphatase